jgi:lipopolysaccharide O-acetyltransferase
MLLPFNNVLVNKNILSYLRFLGFMGGVRMVRDICVTYLFYHNCRLIRFPIYIRGKNKIYFGKGFTSGVGCRLDVFNTVNSNIISFGKKVQINDYVHIAACSGVHFGDRVLIASRVFITDHNHGEYSDQLSSTAPAVPPAERDLFVDPVEVGNDVWIGEGVVILPGVNIGDGVVIGANSVVTKSVQDYSIVAGVPAKVIKKYNFNKEIWESPS